ncbi:hypothetical protein Lal_00039655 [Lupinus albus]|nr:hypothetical protein Lal_00039655 [Lupinus albus]
MVGMRKDPKVGGDLPLVVLNNLYGVDLPFVVLNRLYGVDLRFLYRSCGLWDFGIQVSREMRSYLAPKTFWTLQVDDVCKSEDCILGNTGHLHLINPEIDRTYHRLVRQSRNLPFHSVPDSVSDSNSISDSIPVSLHSVQYTDFVHSVALSDSEHSENSVHSENMAQPPTPPGPRVQKVKCGGHIWNQGHFGHYKWMMCAKVKIKKTCYIYSSRSFAYILKPEFRLYTQARVSLIYSSQSFAYILKPEFRLYTQVRVSLIYSSQSFPYILKPEFRLYTQARVSLIYSSQSR